MSSALPWYILLLPLLASAVIVLITKRSPGLSSFLSVAAVLASFALSCFVFVTPDIQPLEFTWIDLKPVLSVPLGFVLDDLAKTMLLLVTGVGGVIHIYSLGYMREDSTKSRYFAALSFFMFSMLGIVLANNFVMMFIFWELVGVSSYLLIGHWFERDSAAEAAKKAFLTNRIGDFGFMLGILMAWVATGSVVFTEMNQQLARITSYPEFLAVAVLLIFCGAVGKSAQFPLHVWLPDAMEGPTPISALIHAAARRVSDPGLASGALGHRVDRHDHGGRGRAHCDPAKRHQTDPRLLNAFAARLHDHGGRARFRPGGDVPSFHPRVLQGAPLPRRGIHYRDAASRAKHLEDGRARRPARDHVPHLHCGHARVNRAAA